jgi:hypothetical protein
MADPPIQQRLVDIIFDGIAYDYMYIRMKIWRENLRTLKSAREIHVAMEEQSLRKRLTLRSTDTTKSMELLQETCFDITPHFLAPKINRIPTISRHKEPMRIDHYQGIQYHKYRKKEHIKQINALKTKRRNLIIFLVIRDQTIRGGFRVAYLHCVCHSWILIVGF